MEKAQRVRKVIIELPKFKIPEIKDVTEQDYDLIRLSIINSIKGEQVAKSERSRQNFVEDVYLKPAKTAGILSYEDLSKSEKCDFEGDFVGGVHFGLEVKGGEGNSVTLLERPRDAKIFVVWSHLDVMSNTPADNMRGVLARIVKQMINIDEKRQKVDLLVFYDEWYRTGVKAFTEGLTLPDVVIFPEEIPTKRRVHPRLPDASDNVFLRSLMKIVGNVDLDSSDAKRHLWYCDIHLAREGRQWRRRMKIYNGLDPNVTLTEQEYTSSICRPAGS